MSFSDELRERAANEEWIAAQERNRPSSIYRPRLSIDGNQWCALYGDNLQDGVAGFGDSPDKAYYDFDVAWTRPLPIERGAFTAAVEGWRDIASAPKDGTRVILWNGGSEIGCFVEPEGWITSDRRFWPTHWMPLLPSPPESAG